MLQARPIAATLLLLFLVAGCSDDTGSTDPNGGFQLGDELNLTLTPENVNFGAVPLNETRSVDVVLRHTGGHGTLRLLSVELESESSEFTLTSPETMELEPGQSTTLTLTYTPTDGLHDAGQITIATNIPKLGGGAVTAFIPIVTLQQEAAIVSEPFLHDFEGVESGNAHTKDFVLRNIGELPFTLTEIRFKDLGSDFKIVTAPKLGDPWDPGAKASLTLGYEPTDFDTDHGQLQLIGTTVAGPRTFEIELMGHEIWARLQVTPSVVDFGQRLPGQVHTLSVALENIGTAPLTIDEAEVIALSPWSHTIGLVDILIPDGGLTLSQDELLEVEIAFLPDPAMEPSTAPVANIIFHTNDPVSQGATTLPVFGKKQGAGLEVTPPEMLTFGFVGEGGTVTRTLTLTNTSTFPITVDQVWLEGEFSFAHPNDWSPTLPEPLPAELGPGEFKSIDLVFSHVGGDWSTRWGKVGIDSNDLLQPQWEVLLQARAASKAPCVLQLVSDTQDLGFVEAGGSKNASAMLVNIGASECTFDAARIDDCTGASECPSINPQEAFISTSAPFTLSNPPAPGTALLPGESLEVTVSFEGPSMADAEADEVRTFYGLMTLRTTTEASDGTLSATILPDTPTWGGAHNLMARVAKAQLVASPASVDFGAVPIGCQSEPLIITAKNIGQLPLGITDWALVDCPASFIITEHPILSDPTPSGGFVKKLYAGASAIFQVAAAPVDEQLETCKLFIYHTAADLPAEVTLTGQGTFVTDHTDLFTDSATQDVDVLFVVDDSGSMSHEQQNLATSFDAFIKKASEWNSNFQIGVTTTSITFPTAGVLQGSPPFVTPDNWEKFIHNVQVGTTGSGTEQGLWAAKIALGAPTTDVTEEPCSQDSDCGFFHVCMSGFCGGKNQFFIRESASLELVFLSDEEDQSPESTDEYLKYFRSIKGFDKPDQMHIHAIVGPAGGCDSEMGEAVAGHPYLELAQATGGVTYSICEQDFAKGLEGIGEVAFSAQMRYFLTKLPAPTSIEVTIDSYPCPPLTLGQFNWIYDAESNSVKLSEGSVCKAEPGSVVEIYYKLLCFAQ